MKSRHVAAVFSLIAVLAAHAAAADESAVSSDEYLDLVEAAVAAYPDDHVAEYVADADANGVHEHGFPRLTANIGALISAGRHVGRRDLFRRMMDICCRDAKKGPMKKEGNEFSVKELVAALLDVERAGLFPKDVTDGWRRDLAEVDPWRCYCVKPEVGDTARSYNWCVFGAASEQTRISAGVGGDVKFVERYVADQLRWFDEKGMWRDPHEPAVYDLVTRLQFALILSAGYGGPSRAALEGFLDRAAGPTLELQSAAGEIPYGGRSNQFLHNDTLFAALCEWYAARAMSRGDAETAARFLGGARRAVDSVKGWLAARPVRHVKNRYPRGSGKRGTGIGCEGYAYFDKYMVTMGSWAVLARRFAFEMASPEVLDIRKTVRPVFYCLKPRVFATTPYFHFVFLNAGDYSAQFDYNSDSHYDCDGMGRLHRRGAPTAICISTPCALKPNYSTERTNDRTLAFVPAGGEGVLTPAGNGSDDKAAWANWRKGELDWKCRLTAEGLESGLSGPGDVAMTLPAFEFDGETATEVSCDGKSLSISYRGWVCRYETDGAIADTGAVCCNRNGRYRVFEARGVKSLSVRVSIESSKLSVSAADDCARGIGLLAKEVQAKLPARPGLPGADRAGWASLAARPEAAKIVASAEKMLVQPVPDAPDELYLEFWENGNRSHYEKRYFDRVRRLVTLTVAEALERKGRFAPKIVEFVDAICAMKSWVLPAHDGIDGGRGNFRGTATTVDLFASQLASHLAYMVNFIGDSLPPESLAKVKREVERRIFAPLRLSYSLMDEKGGFSKKSDPLRHWWTCGGSNWNAVCHDNVVTAALALLDDPSDRAYFVANALRGLGYYARGGFASDGYCSEGMGYWNYGFGHLLMLGLVLRDLTGGSIDVFAEPIYRKAAEYAYAYQLERGVSPAFADGNGAPSATNLALVRRVWPDLTCRAAESVSPFGTAADGVAGIYLDHYAALLGFGKMAAPSGSIDAPLPIRSEFPAGQVWLMRCGEELSVAVKGGHNGELHNHNDVGSYYLVSHGRLLSGDPGGEVYTARTFGPRRYESKVINSYAHPVPVVGGSLQSTGAKFAAKVLATDFSDSRDTVVLDISGAYEVKSLKTLVRTFSFDRKAKTFTVSDRVEFSEPTDFEEAYTTFEGGKFGKAHVDVAVTAGGETVHAVEHIDNPGRISPDRHSVRFASPVDKAEISLTFRATR